MTDWAASGRVDDYRCELVDPFTLKAVGEAAFVPTASSVTYDYESANVVGATIQLASGADYRRGGKGYMLRLTDVVTMPDGTQAADVLGTFFVDNCSKQTKHGHASSQLTCYSALWRHSSDVLMNDFARPAGTVVVDAIRAVVEADGGRLAVAADVPASRRTGSDIWFELGEGKLDVVREMAAWLGCEVMPQADGSLLLRQKAAPGDLEPSYVFEAGSNCVYVPGVSWDSTRSKILNRVVYYLSTEGGCQKAVADLPQASEWSYDSIGYHRTEVVRVTELPEGGLQAAAKAYLAENSGETVHIEIEHVGIPGLGVGDVVRYVNDADCDGTLCVDCQVVQMEVDSLTPGRLTKTKLRIVRWC